MRARLVSIGGDLLYPMAPKPMLIAVSAHDFFGTYSPSYISNGRAEYVRLKRAYEVLGKNASKVSWYETALPHGLSHDLRVQIYNHFESVFRGSDKSVVEPIVQLEADEQLYAGSAQEMSFATLAARPRSPLRAQRREPSVEIAS